jgi:coenzyme F420-reducing hydrogenase gamma subunit
MGKPKVAFFDFACCEGCQLQIVNLEEDVIGLANLVDVVEFREAISDRYDGTYDISFIEGSITRTVDENRIKEIRERSNMLVTLGQCSTTGGINKLKNLRPDLETVKRDVYKENADMPHLDTYPTKAVDEVVKVDFKIPGCPINKHEFIRVVKELLLGRTPRLPNHPVCVECKLNENECLFEKGQICLGPITRAGCDAICPSNGVTCDGCRGTVDNPNKNAMHDILEKYGYSVDRIEREMNLFAITPEVKK